MDSKKIIFKALVLFCIFQVLIVSCKSSKDTSSKPIKISSKVEDFDSFYDKFHSDSIFQKSRVNQPLKGQKFDGTEVIHWTKDNFGLVKKRVYDIDTALYKVNYQKSANEFIQKVWIEDSGYSSEYKFKLIGNKWFLVSVVLYNI